MIAALEIKSAKIAAEEMQMMRKLYQEMIMEKAGIKGEKLPDRRHQKSQDGRERNGDG